MKYASSVYGKRFFVDPDEKLRLPKLDPGYKGDHELEEAAKPETEHYRAKLTHKQAMLYAQRKHSVLVVLQALDAGGKDGTVSHVFSALNPQGTTAVGFKQPTSAELAHDFLWRVHPHRACKALEPTSGGGLQRRTSRRDPNVFSASDAALWR